MPVRRLKARLAALAICSAQYQQISKSRVPQETVSAALARSSAGHRHEPTPRFSSPIRNKREKPVWRPSRIPPSSRVAHILVARRACAFGPGAARQGTFGMICALQHTAMSLNVAWSKVGSADFRLASPCAIRRPHERATARVTSILACDPPLLPAVRRNLDHQEDPAIDVSAARE